MIVEFAVGYAMECARGPVILSNIDLPRMPRPGIKDFRDSEVFIESDSWPKDRADWRLPPRAKAVTSVILLRFVRVELPSTSRPEIALEISE